MSRSLTAQDRSSLIKLASSLPAGSAERKAILAGLSKTKTAAMDADQFLKQHASRIRCGEKPDGSGVNFAGVNLRSLELMEAVLRGADFSGAILGKTNFYKANLRFANFSNADLTGCNFLLALLTEANLSGANLGSVHFQRADLEKANLRGANLRRADLSQTDLRDADLRGADLTEASLQGADLRRAKLDGAKLDGANLKGAIMPSETTLKSAAKSAKRVAEDILNLYNEEDSFARRNLSYGTRDRFERVIAVMIADGAVFNASALRAISSGDSSEMEEVLGDNRGYHEFAEILYELSSSREEL